MSVKTTWGEGEREEEEAKKIYFSDLPPPTALNPGARSVGTYDTKMAASNGLRFRS